MGEEVLATWYNNMSIERVLAVVVSNSQIRNGVRYYVLQRMVIFELPERDINHAR